MGLNSCKKRLSTCLLEGAVMSPPTVGIQGADSAVSLEKTKVIFLWYHNILKPIFKEFF